MRFSVFFLSLVVFTSCKKVHHPHVDVVSHAGAGLGAIHSPYIENSQEAIDYVLSFDDCAGVEIDVQLSKDSSLWVFHDQNMKEKLGIDDCLGSFTDEEIKAFRLPDGQALIRLNDFDFSKYPGKRFYLDIKHWTPCDAFEWEMMRRGIEKINWADSDSSQIVLMLSNTAWLADASILFDQVMFVANTAANVEETISTHPNLYGVEVKFTEVDETLISKWKSQGLYVGIFQLRAAKSIKKAINLAPDFIETDDFKTAINIVSNGK